jgi:hypothetical protein
MMNTKCFIDDKEIITISDEDVKWRKIIFSCIIETYFVTKKKQKNTQHRDTQNRTN